MRVPGNAHTGVPTSVGRHQMVCIPVSSCITPLLFLFLRGRASTSEPATPGNPSTCMGTLRLLCGCWDLNSSPHDGGTSSSTSERSRQQHQFSFVVNEAESSRGEFTKPCSDLFVSLFVLRPDSPWSPGWPSTHYPLPQPPKC